MTGAGFGLEEFNKNDKSINGILPVDGLDKMNIEGFGFIFGRWSLSVFNVDYE